MKGLSALFTDAGCTDVQTYVQSGNVIFGGTPSLARRIPVVIEKAIAAQFGLRVPVVTRRAAELHDAAKNNPFLPRESDTGTLHVAFLAAKPEHAKVATLDHDRSPPRVRGARSRDLSATPERCGTDQADERAL